MPYGKGLLTTGADEPAPAGDDPRNKYERCIDAAERYAAKSVNDFDRHLKQFREGRFGKDSGDGVSANRTFAYATMLMAYLMAQSAPSIEIEPRDTEGGGAEIFSKLAGMGLFQDADAARKAWADALESEQKHSYEVCDATVPNRVALMRALIVGQGGVKVAFDEARQLDRVDAVERHELYVDPQAKQSLKQGRYCLQTCIWEIEQAREFFEARGGHIEANWQYSDGAGIQGVLQKQMAPHNETPDMYKFYEVWCKEGENRLLYYYEARTKRLICDPLPWPFILDLEDFPFCLLNFNTQYLHACDGFSELEVVEGLQVTYEEGVEFIRRHVGRSRAKKIFYDKGKIDPELMNKVMSSKDMEPVGIKVEDGKRLSEYVQVVDFNSSTDSDWELLGGFKREADEITGQDELVRGADSQTKKTATEAGIRDANSKLRNGRRQTLFDDFLAEQVRKKSMVARQLVSPETIAKISGPRAGLLWSVYAPEPEDMLREYSIGIAAGSTSERHKQERREALMQMLDTGAKINQAYAAPIYNLIELSKDIARLNSVRRPERYINLQVAELVNSPPPPAPAGLPTPAPAGPAATGPAPIAGQAPTPASPAGAAPSPEGAQPA